MVTSNLEKLGARRSPLDRVKGAFGLSTAKDKRAEQSKRQQSPAVQNAKNRVLVEQLREQQEGMYANS